MDTSELLLDGFERVAQVVHAVLDASTPEQLIFRADGAANTVAWLVWHLARVQDDHVAGVAGTGQVWLDDGWERRFGLPFAAAATGYGHSPGDVGAVDASVELLAGYFDAVHERTRSFVAGLDAADLDRVVDADWNPPVTLGVRLVSVLSDDLQHAGQAALVRGVAERA